MRAAVYRGVNQVAVEEVPQPRLEPGEILVRVHTCGVCGTDLKKIHLGLVDPPRIFGHETAGTVAEVAPGEAEWRAGDRVVVQHHLPCRECFYCRRKQYAHCPGYKRTGTTAGFEPAGGGFAEYVRVLPFARPGIVRIPDGVTFEEASFLEPLNTVMKGVQVAGARSGEMALVIGQGPIGLLFTQVLRQTGLAVVGTDLFPRRREIASQWGAQAVDPRGADLPALCRDLTDGRGADLAVVAVASTTVIPEAMKAIRLGGRVLLFAQTRLGDLAAVDAGQVCMLEKALLGSYSADLDLQETCAEWLFSRRIEVAPLISHRFPLEEIATALEVASRPTETSLKVVVQP